MVVHSVEAYPIFSDRELSSASAHLRVYEFQIDQLLRSLPFFITHSGYGRTVKSQRVVRAKAFSAPSRLSMTLGRTLNFFRLEEVAWATFQRDNIIMVLSYEKRFSEVSFGWHAKENINLSPCWKDRASLFSRSFLVLVETLYKLNCAKLSFANLPRRLSCCKFPPPKKSMANNCQQEHFVGRQRHGLVYEGDRQEQHTVHRLCLSLLFVSRWPIIRRNSQVEAIVENFYNTWLHHLRLPCLVVIHLKNISLWWRKWETRVSRNRSESKAGALVKRFRHQQHHHFPSLSDSCGTQFIVLRVNPTASSLVHFNRAVYVFFCLQRKARWWTFNERNVGPLICSCRFESDAGTNGWRGFWPSIHNVICIDVCRKPRGR